MKEIVGSPLFIYILELVFLILYFLFHGRNETAKNNILVIGTSLIVIFTFNSVDINQRFLLNAFDSDTIYVDFDEKRMVLKFDDLFQKENLVISKKNSILEYLKDFKREPLMEVKFYKNGKEMIKLKVYEAKEESEYSFYLNNKLAVLKYNGFLLKYNENVYKKLNKFIE